MGSTYDPERDRRYREANRERIREYRKQYYQENRDRLMEKAREYREANREVLRERTRRYVARTGYRDKKARERDQAKARLWDQQDGKCYLCADPLESAGVGVLDHDHRCCPLDQFCRFCIRGLACQSCNKMIGYARDDPQRLRRVAANLGYMLETVTARLKYKPEQETLKT